MASLSRRSRPERSLAKRPAILALAALGVVMGSPASASAQDGFFFQRPGVSFGFRAGYAVPTAQGDLFGFIQEQLTVDGGSFNTASWGGEVAIAVSDHFDITLDLAHSRRLVASEFRHWVDLDDQPIQQTTYMSRTPVTANVRWYPLERGRAVGRFTWVPMRWTPFLGAGAGFMSYKFEQDGDFVDYEDLDIFPSTLTAEGTTLALNLSGGLGYQVGNRTILTGMARYTWASDQISGDFDGFESLDLGGLEFTLGIAIWIEGGG